MKKLNEYLTAISEEIYLQGGYVDKFIGDAVMAMWNQPRPQADHAAAAIRAALRIRERVAELARAGNHPFTVKVGLETGRVVVGNVGSPKRLEFSAIGDVVNLSARLEGACGFLGAGILVGPAAEAAAASTPTPGAPPVPLIRLTRLVVKGRVATTEVFTPLGASNPGVVEIHQQAFAAFDAGDFATAAARWDSLDRGEAPWSVALAREARALLEAPPADWNGALTLSAK
jgi:adenylate cyclase